MTKETRLIKNTMIIAIGNICTKCISFFLLPLYTTILSTNQYGTVDLISTYVSLFSAILTIQFEQGVFRYLIEVRDNINKQKKYISTCISTIIFLNLIFAIVIVPILYIVKYKYTFYLVIWIIVASCNAILIQLPRGLGNTLVYAEASCISGVTNVILNVIFIVAFRLGVNGMLCANIIALIISGVYIILKIKLWKYVDKKLWERQYFYKLFKYSFPLIPNTLCWWIVNVSDRLIINTFIGIAANGIYSVACKFPSLFSMVTNIFQLAWTESASESIEEKDSNKYFEQILNYAIRFYSSCNMGFIAILPLVYSFLIKNDFKSAYLYIPILMTGSLFHSIADLYGSIYTAQKRTSEIAKTTILSAVINIIINILFVKKLGLYAAAISTLLAYVVITVIRHLDIKKQMQIVISKKYLIKECIMYLILFFVYYLKIKKVQYLIIFIVVPHCIIQNKIIIENMISGVLKKIRR